MGLWPTAPPIAWADMEPSPQATYVWTAPDRNMPDEQGRARSYLTAANACHVVAVEIDRETGKPEPTHEMLGARLGGGQPAEPPQASEQT